MSTKQRERVLFDEGGTRIVLREALVHVTTSAPVEGTWLGRRVVLPEGGRVEVHGDVEVALSIGALTLELYAGRVCLRGTRPTTFLPNVGRIEA
jgi:hypothetical protein